MLRGGVFGKNTMRCHVGITSVLRRCCRAALVAGAFTSVAACIPETPSSPRGPTPDKAAQAACLAEGGTYEIAGIAGQYVCIRPTVDAGKSCSAESDCSGFCMAETRTCSAVTPMFGCHPILLDDGSHAEICID
ncbi:hypothetical protein NBRC116590_24940 [Pelagimonas sp. KU-00592-HH]